MHIVLPQLRESRGRKRSRDPQRAGLRSARTDGISGPVAGPLTADALPLWEVIPGIDGAARAPGADITRRRDSGFRRALGGSDVVASYGALFLVLRLFPAHLEARAGVALAAPMVVLLSKILGLYDRDQHRLRKATIDELPVVLSLAVFYSLGVWLAQAALLEGALSRAQVLALVVIGFALLSAGRFLTRIVVLRFTPPERCLVIGASRECRRAVEAIQHGETAGLKAVVVGQIGWTPLDGDRSANPRDLPVLHQLVSEQVTSAAVERVIVAPDGCEEEEVLHLIRLIKALGVKLSVLPRLLEVVGSASVFDELDGLSLLGVRSYGLSKSSGMLKRVIDVVLAGVLLLVLSPFLILIAGAIKLNSPGPVFFRQRRTGRRGREFAMIKFRSMVHNAEEMKARLSESNEAEGGLFKISADPWVTRTGRFLRKTSVDELPQLLNVLRGDMSLVGPRPLIPDEDILIEGWRRRRLALKPGMTGLWQIFGSSRIPMGEMVKLDYMYGANWSLWLDLKILLRTVPYVLTRRGI
jgi:exopolysaccharide biosynthesis polyprenyl glycosylphosphotransferase